MTYPERFQRMAPIRANSWAAPGVFNNGVPQQQAALNNSAEIFTPPASAHHRLHTRDSPSYFYNFPGKASVSEVSPQRYTGILVSAPVTMSTASQQSSYSPAQPFGGPYNYDDPTQHQLQSTRHSQPSYSLPYEENLSQQPPQQTIVQGPVDPAPKVEALTSEPKTRLRKACDSCSIRKVKCDESGPPCKSCAALDIPCTFERPSRRRGPPNRHAEAIKRQKLEADGSYSAVASSPTRDAAYSLAALAAPALLSAESICDINTLEVLIDDYFIYIHPLVPVPHEPTFRAAFARREDRINRSFLAMLAGMIETLVASFPRRVRQVFSSDEAREQYPNAGVLMDRCHQIFVEARGLGFLDQAMNLNHVCASYFAGLAAAYTFDVRRMALYYGECVMTLRTLGFHTSAVNAASNDPGLTSPLEPGNISYIYQQTGRRLFWLLFVGAMSMHQLDDTSGDILMPPMAYADRLPPLPQEVDDEFITEHMIYEQPSDVVPEIKGFNLNVKVFMAFHQLAALELAFGADTVYDWERQRNVIRRTLNNVKAATNDAPLALQLVPVHEYGEWPPTSLDAASYAHGHNTLQSTADIVSFPSTSNSQNAPFTLTKRAVQYEIQKANIYATQLASRSYLVEKFWNLYEIHASHGEKVGQTSSLSHDWQSSTSSPTAGSISNLPMTTGFVPQHRSGRTPSDSQMDTGEQAMAVEREDIVRDMAQLLQSINQVNMEPNGLSFCNKIRQVASTLLETKRQRMSIMPTLDHESVNAYLYGFLDILSKLQRLGPGKIRGSGALTGEEATGMDGKIRTPEEIDEEELVHWASLKEHQEKFVQSETFMAGL